ncbi:MAG: flavin-containing monooxygenase [Rhodothermales bacterium]
MRPIPERSIATNTLVIGGGAAGLAAAACLSRRRIPHILLEKGQSIGSSWLNRYDRLHLHTHGFFSSLPYLSFPRHFPRYPSRLQFAEYLATYADAFQLKPRFGEEVSSLLRQQQGWVAQTQNVAVLAKHVVVATGYSHKPRRPSWPGEETFAGQILHSSAYVNGEQFKDKRVLVVGFGNSAGEIAIDLHEHGAQVSMAVRNPVNIVPRDLFGLSTHVISVMMSRLPTELADALSKNLRNLVVGDMAPYGLEKANIGPMTMIKRENRVPLLDIGTVGLIKTGKIVVQKGIDYFDGRQIKFVDGVQKDFDAVVLATGYTTNLTSFLENADTVTDDHGRVIGGGHESALPGLYFCGLHNAPAGLIRQMGIDAKRIAKSISKKPRSIARVTSQDQPAMLAV